MTKLSAYNRTLPYAYTPGIFPSLALLDARPECARRLLLHSAAADTEGVTALRDRCAALSIRVETADHALLKLSKKDNCYAAIVFDKYECKSLANRPHLVLHQPSDMGNLGTVLRVCLGFGLTDIALIRPAADMFDPRVVRASMGAIFSMRLKYYDHFEDYRSDHPSHALYPFMLDGSIPLKKAVALAKAPYTLVFGNEATGLPDSFHGMGQTIRIPHSNAIDSLNLAMAVSIAVYAFTETNF